MGSGASEERRTLRKEEQTNTAEGARASHGDSVTRRVVVLVTPSAAHAAAARTFLL